MLALNLVASLFIATGAMAQAVPEGIGPDASPPQGCKTSVDSNFTIGVLNGFDKRDSGVATAQEAADNYLVCSLKNGILRDQSGRTGSVVANRQFQFDGPPQAGAIYTGGFSICANSSLAIGGTTRWWQCSSGAFFNLYDQWIGDQCEEIRIQTNFGKSSASSSASGVASSTVSSAASSVASTALSTSSPTTSSETSRSSGSPTSGSTSLSSSRSTTTIASSSSSSTRPSSSGSSSSPAATQNTAAPPANVGAGAVSQMRSGATLGAVLAIVGAALLL